MIKLPKNLVFGATDGSKMHFLKNHPKKWPKKWAKMAIFAQKWPLFGGFLKYGFSNVHGSKNFSRHFFSLKFSLISRFCFIFCVFRGFAEFHIFRKKIGRFLTPQIDRFGFLDFFFFHICESLKIKKFFYFQKNFKISKIKNLGF